jgi:glycosyltransferase involved in cell wall biosynthesis
MRILMLAQFYPPIVGGEEQHVRTLSTELAARGHHVAVATLGQAGLPAFEVDRGVRIYRIHGTSQRAAWLFSEAGRRPVPPLPHPEQVASLRRGIAAEQPQIVHAHNWLVHSFLPLNAWSKARLVLTLHDYSLRCAKNSFLYGTGPCSGPGVVKCLRCASAHYGPTKGIPTAIANSVMGLWERGTVDQFLAVSAATAAGNGITPDRWPLEIIPNFLPEDLDPSEGDYSAWLAQLPQEPFLLFVGDLRGFKGIPVLLRAYAGLPDAPPLVLIGRRCADTPAAVPPGVRILPPWPREAVLQAWPRSLIGIMPSIGPETFGIVVLEAMAAGRPVVASRIGGLPDVVVDGETGVLVPPGDAGALQQALARLLADAGLREWMGRAARQRVVQYRTSAVLPRIEAVYRRLLAGENAGYTRSREPTAPLQEGLR